MSTEKYFLTESFYMFDTICHERVGINNMMKEEYLTQSLFYMLVGK